MDGIDSTGGTGGIGGIRGIDGTTGMEAALTKAAARVAGISERDSAIGSLDGNVCVTGGRADSVLAAVEEAARALHSSHWPQNCLFVVGVVIFSDDCRKC